MIRTLGRPVSGIVAHRQSQNHAKICWLFVYREIRAEGLEALLRPKRTIVDHESRAGPRAEILPRTSRQAEGAFPGAEDRSKASGL